MIYTHVVKKGLLDIQSSLDTILLSCILQPQTGTKVPFIRKWVFIIENFVQHLTSWY